MLPLANCFSDTPDNYLRRWGFLCKQFCDPAGKCMMSRKFIHTAI